MSLVLSADLMDHTKCRVAQLRPMFFVSQDTVIYERLADSSRYKDITLKHLEQFATEGERHTPA